MAQFLARRLMLFVPMLFMMSVVSFLIILAPPGDFLNDYAAFLAEQGEEVTEEKLEWMREKYGLNEPVYVQYYKWISGVVRWDLGKSLEYNRPVTELVNQRLLLTVILGLLTVTFTWTLAIPIGILSAVKQYSWMDYAFTFLSYFGVGTPNFLLALVTMYFALTVLDMNVTGLFSSEYADAHSGYRWHGPLYADRAREPVG